MTDTIGPPSILVRKYGGSSLASVERIAAVAHDVATCKLAGHQIVVVVSAMGQSTDELARLAHQVNPSPPRREMDMLLSVGERITMSLLSMALAAENCAAISYTGSQCGIITDCSHTDARIIEVRGDRVRQSLAEGYVVVVAGFQGVSRKKEITTLGRGGSDATAVALAAALGARRCEILTDVEGVMTADPDKLATVRRHESLDFEEMTAIAAAGCEVVHHRAVEYAARHKVPIYVGSSFHNTPGTVIGPTPIDRPVPTSDGTGTQLKTIWRPLVMTVDENVDWLEISNLTEPTLAELQNILNPLLPAKAPLAEWLDTGPEHRWSILGDPEATAALHAAAEKYFNDGEHMTCRRGIGCIALTGCKPRSWLKATVEIQKIVAALDVDDIVIRAAGGTLRLLVPASSLPHLLEPLHEALFAD